MAVLFALFWLIYFNYSDFLIGIWNRVFRDDLVWKSLRAPLGISFVTFSAISYLADIYRDSSRKGNLIDCLLYMTFFPKVVSGPIVLWKDFQGQIAGRRLELDQSIDGLNRIMIGFAKKVILADSFGACIAKIGLFGIDRITAVGTILLYMLQLYYDFSGYSDIAIGLSKLFGFHFKENFNFPYRSKSITEFWRRWHISLGMWFREYVYFPLGGSRCGMYKTLRNLAIVFALTGIWHGAGWNYVLWGAINGLVMLLERVAREKKGRKWLPAPISYVATTVLVMMFWQLFRYQNLGNIATLLKIIAGFVSFENISYTWQHYYDARIIVFVVVGVLGATVLGDERLRARYQTMISRKSVYVVQEMGLLILFAISILFMVNSTYSPFIYFQY